MLQEKLTNTQATSNIILGYTMLMFLIQYAIKWYNKKDITKTKKLKN